MTNHNILAVTLGKWRQRKKLQFNIYSNLSYFQNLILFIETDKTWHFTYTAKHNWFSLVLPNLVWHVWTLAKCVILKLLGTSNIRKYIQKIYLFQEYLNYLNRKVVYYYKKAVKLKLTIMFMRPNNIFTNFLPAS